MSPLSLLVVACFSSALLVSASSSSSSTAAFDVDTSSQGPALSRVVVDSFGSSHGSTTLRATWRDHFLQVLKDIPFRRVRFHGILDDDMSAYMPSLGEAVAPGGASGALLFDTLDFFVASGISPTVELSYMPAGLALNASAYYRHYGGLRSTYANATAWRSFVTGLARLCIARYGAAVVRGWRFEVWNEPNCGDLEPANGCCPDCGPKDVYFDLFRQTSLALKAADPDVQVGGPATAMLAWIPDLTSFCNSTGTPIDFISSHLYPTDPTLPATRDNFMEAVANATAQAASAGLPFYLTEFNAGLGEPASLLIDSSFAASFLLHQHLQAQAVPNLLSMSWWTFTDWGFEEQGADPQPWNPGTTKFGIMTNEAVPKPVYRGLQFISDAAGDATLAVAPASTSSSSPLGGGRRTYLGLRGQGGSAADAPTVVGATEGAVDVSVTTREGVVTALLASFNCSSCSPPPDATTVTLTFRGLKAPLPTAGTLELIDGANANPMATWVSAGSPVYPSQSLIFAQLAASEVEPVPLTLAPAGVDAVTAQLVLQPFAMARVRFAAA
jgi:xylan 1,4-beta-xylosidase